MCVFNKEDPQEVLASWLFAQYMLTNKVQMAYSQTEGYLPVTTKTLESEEYQDYLARKGENNDLYYSAKLDATQLLLDNIENTFVTPVFNGSASLRDAAGQMIENSAKAARRKQNVDGAFIEKLYSDMTSLYRLDQHVSTGAGKTELGPLPQTSVILLCVLGVVWVLILLYVGKETIRKGKSKDKY